MQRNDCVVDTLLPEELVSNGDFTGGFIDGRAAFWNVSGTIVLTQEDVDGHPAQGVTGGSTGDVLEQIINYVSGYQYELLVENTRLAGAGNTYARLLSDVIGSSSNVITMGGEGTKRYTYRFVSQLSGGSRVRFYSDGSTTGALTKVSIKRIIPGNTYNDLLHQYYLDNGAISDDLQDAEYQFLISQGATPASIPDMWFQMLGTLGYTGALSDRIKDFWCVGEGSLIP